MLSGIKQTRIPKEFFDKKSAQDLARADDDGFAKAEGDTFSQSPLQDSDCWSNLWQSIKTNSARFLK